MQDGIFHYKKIKPLQDSKKDDIMGDTNPNLTAPLELRDMDGWQRHQH